jgi:exopolysaccharide biosynthesis predicted pyruvyltransferase EpsI
MGKLLNDDALYYNLSKTSKELELLLQDVRLHPTRYVNASLWKERKPYKAPVDTIVKKKLVIMSYLDNILFALLLVIGFGYFSQV